MSGVIRISVSSRRPCRAISWPAAYGIRWVKPSSATTSPSRTRDSTASLSDVITRTGPLERERVPFALDGDPAQLGELVHRRLAAEAPPARVLDAAERHLRLVADGLVVDVDDAGVDPLRECEAAVDVARDDAGAETVR